MIHEAKEIDSYVGRKVRQLRKQRGASKEVIGDILGVSFQQVQKYENGTNRISAGKLAIIARYFAVPVGVFFGHNTSPSKMSDAEVAYFIDGVKRGVVLGINHSAGVMCSYADDCDEAVNRCLEDALADMPSGVQP